MRRQHDSTNWLFGMRGSVAPATTQRLGRQVRVKHTRMDSVVRQIGFDTDIWRPYRIGGRIEFSSDEMAL
eukprot:8253573-Pyramimonas_sp.AAC.3